MKYPNVTRYLETISEPYGMFRTLSDPEFLRDDRGNPAYIAGSRSVTFTAKIAGRLTGVKCYTRENPDREKRYARLSEYLEAHPSPYLTHFRYLPAEAYVYDDFGEGFWYPVLATEWAKGPTLTEYLRRKCAAGDAAAVGKAAEEFLTMTLWLLGSDFRHGDLKFDNIVVTAEGLKLIDMDGFWLADRELPPSDEIGTPGFQHPHRRRADYGPFIDDYSIAVIYTTLRAYAERCELFSEYLPQESILFPPEECLSDRCGLLDEFRERWLKEGKTDLYRLSGLLRSASPRLEQLPDVLRSLHDRSATPTHTALRLFRRDGKYGFLDGKGEEAIPPVYDDAGEFGEGLAPVRCRDRWFFIDTAGSEAIGLDAVDSAAGFREGLAVVKTNGRYGFIDPAGQWVIPALYEEAGSFHEGLAAVKRDGKYGFISPGGEPVIGFRFDIAGNFHEGVAVVGIGGLFGYIDRRGNFLTSVQYTVASAIRKGRAAAEKGVSKKILKMINQRIYEYNG